MPTRITDDSRASQAFIESLRRTADMVFSKTEIVISGKKKMGDPVVCTIEARKGNGDSSHAKGQAYIYFDLVIVCVESVSKKSMEPIYPHQYEYHSY
jgi:hypothetical protein